MELDHLLRSDTEENFSFFFSNWISSPTALFHTCLCAGAVVIVTVASWMQHHQNHYMVTEPSLIHKQALQLHDKPLAVTLLQRNFLAVFWLLKCADWLQGPYFYEVYASKLVGSSDSMGIISKLFLTGFATTAILGPNVGKASEEYGRKKATMAFCFFFGLAALSTKSNSLFVLFAGRVCSGIATSLLSSAPESWLVGQFQAIQKDNSPYLKETFAMAYAGDSCVAILAGQIATLVASVRGPTGPFELSAVCLIIGGFLTAWLWHENEPCSPAAEACDHEETVTIREAINAIAKDPNIVLIGIVQSLFEGAMYIFVMEWAPAMEMAIKVYFAGNQQVDIPYGTIFSCLMTSGLFGSMLFGQMTRLTTFVSSTEDIMAIMLTLAFSSMAGAAILSTMKSNSTLWGFIACFFCFEACVGMYFPSIGTLRSKYSHSHRSVVMNLFGIPLNVLVVSVFLNLDRLGLQGAFATSSMALGLAACAMFQLRRRMRI